MSDEVIIDLTSYKERVGARVPAGRYRVQVEDVESAESSKGNPMINLWLRITGGEYDGHTIVDRLTLTDRSMFRVVNFMQAIGMPTPRKRMRLNIKKFVGRTLEIDVEDGDPFRGQIKSEVRGYMKVEKSDSANESDLDDLDDEGDDTDEATPRMKKSAPSAPSPEEEVEEVDLEDLEV